MVLGGLFGVPRAIRYLTVSRALEKLEDDGFFLHCTGLRHAILH